MGYAHRVKPRHKVKLEDFDPGEDAGQKRKEAEKETARLIEELVEMQELLYAVREQSLLVILQGRDTSGKDGTIRHVAGPLDSQGCGVASFKIPTEEELAHDFLWRVHAQTPSAGQIKIFNRSHYEDVLVVRVHKLVPKQVWRRRYEHINAFERLLADSSTIILKFYLHISKEEQERRLMERAQDSIKSWKLSVIHPSAVIDPSAKVAADVWIGACSVIGPFSEIAEGVRIHPNVTIYEDVKIGKDSVIHSGSVIRERSELGQRVVIHNNVVVGCDGFGYAKDEDRRWLKIPQTGRVVIEDDVEIGAGTTIDRASVGESRIGRGTKIDNLVQIGHSCTVGEDTLLCAQVGLAGSSHIGNRVILAGQAGVAGHLTIGDDVVLTAKSATSHDVPAGKVISGIPAFDNRDWLRSTAAFRRLGEMQRTIRELERRLAAIAKNDGSS